MDDKAILAKLCQLSEQDKTETDRANLTRTMINVLEMHARAISKNQSADNVLLNGITALHQQWLNTEDPSGAARRYFSGVGPVGTKLREHIVLHEIVTGKDCSERSKDRFTEIYDKYFVAAIEYDETILAQYRDLIKEISVYFSGKERRPTIVGTGCIPSTLDLDHSGVFTAIDPATNSSYNILYLKFETQDVYRGYLMVTDQGEVRVRILHPGEGTWVECDWHFLLAGMLESLDESFQAVLEAVSNEVGSFDADEAKVKIEKSVIDLLQYEHILREAEGYYDKVNDTQVMFTFPVPTMEDLSYQITVDRKPDTTSFSHLLLRSVGEHYEKVVLTTLPEFKQRRILHGVESVSRAVIEAIDEDLETAKVLPQVTHQVETHFKH